jgi:hypothetical protein
MRALLVAVLAGATLAAAAPAPAVPPRTCGRVTLDGKPYVVRKHGNLTCGFALREVRAFHATRRGPKGYRCRDAGELTPVHCLLTRAPSRYFFASAAS